METSLTDSDGRDHRLSDIWSCQAQGILFLWKLVRRENEKKNVLFSVCYKWQVLINVEKSAKNIIF